jgi:hypothetical protein
MNGGEVSNNTVSAYAMYYRYGDLYYYDSSSRGGGVYVDGGTFTMTGGTIAGNTVRAGRNESNNGGGGVYAYRGAFRMSGGIIYGYEAAEGLKNTASGGGEAFRRYSDSVTAQYGTFSGGTFYSSGNLTIANRTIRIVNGNLLTE